MKILFKIIWVVLILHGCNKGKPDLNQFSSFSDTLIIHTQKQKGRGLFSSSSYPLKFKDTSDKFSYSLLYPKEISNIKRLQKITNINNGIEDYVDFITGKIGDKKIFIVDENNNRDLTDDSVRVCKRIKWYSSEELMRCNYITSYDGKIVKDYSWIQFRNVNNDLWLSRKEYLTGDIYIDGEFFQIGVVDLRNGFFTYEIYPEIALLSKKGKPKDTLLSSEVLKLDEFLNLNGNYYRFSNILKSGKYITLIKENNFKNKIGLQIGMNAPSFEAISISGDTINSGKLNDKVTLIANACGCGGDKMSIKAYYDIENSYSDKINLIALDSKIDKNTEGVFIDVDEKFNKDIYNKYRQAYCSRVCYVIGENNRIIDKFEVVDWKSNLPRLLN